MDYEQFLTRVIDDGIAAAKADYIRPDQKEKLEGAIAGFEACRGKSPEKLCQLLTAAGRKTWNAYALQAKDYWRVRCFELEVAWVANVVSAMLWNQGAEVIIPPTAHGVLKAAAILGGVGEKNAEQTNGSDYKGKRTEKKGLDRQ